MVKRTVWTMELASAPRREVNLLHLHNKDVDNLFQQLGNIYGPVNALDHERLPLHRERDVDDLDETATAETPQLAV